MRDDWALRPATDADRDFLYELNKEAMGPYVEATWGWNDEEQRGFFDERFDPSNRRVIRVGDADVGVLAIDDESTSELRLLTMALLPAWQGRGIGSDVLRSLLASAFESGRGVTLRVLRCNPRARALYESFGFTQTGESDTHVFMRADPTH